MLGFAKVPGQPGEEGVPPLTRVVLYAQAMEGIRLPWSWWCPSNGDADVQAWCSSPQDRELAIGACASRTGGACF